MTDHTLTAEERIAQLEARVAELEQRLPPEAPLLGSGRRLTDAQVDAVWTLLSNGPASVGPTDWQRAMLAENLYDPTVPWARIEIERMREE
ncbi:MAG: hypothetical protein K2X87_09895 [Gemmataceae bacterium]|nr:hypothetical protein [Gemmataceae bacterium]